MVNIILTCMMLSPLVLGGVLMLAEFGKWLVEVLFG